MIVMKSSVFPASPETVFEKLQKLETLQYIAKPYATFEPVGAAKLVWEVGSTSAYRFRLFGVIPFGTHKIYIVRFDPEGFVNIDTPYDKEHHAARYSFTQCPNAEFAKKHGLLHILPLLCNSDFFGISEIHGTLIRCGTCGNSDVCDYLVVGSDNPMAAEYVTVSDEQGFLVSRKRLPEKIGD